MKIQPVNFLIAIALSALLSYGLWSMDAPLKNYIAVGAFVFLAGTLTPCIGIHYEQARRAVNLKVLCAVFFLLGLVENVAFSLLDASATFYIITCSISFLISSSQANISEKTTFACF